MMLDFNVTHVVTIPDEEENNTKTIGIGLPAICSYNILDRWRFIAIEVSSQAYTYRYNH